MPVRTRSARVRRAKSKRTTRPMIVQKRDKEERWDDRSRRTTNRDIFEEEWDWL